MRQVSACPQSIRWSINQSNYLIFKHTLDLSMLIINNVRKKASAVLWVTPVKIRIKWFSWASQHLRPVHWWCCVGHVDRQHVKASMAGFPYRLLFITVELPKKHQQAEFLWLLLPTCFYAPTAHSSHSVPKLPAVNRCGIDWQKFEITRRGDQCKILESWNCSSRQIPHIVFLKNRSIGSESHGDVLIQLEFRAEESQDRRHTFTHTTTTN